MSGIKAKDVGVSSMPICNRCNVCSRTVHCGREPSACCDACERCMENRWGVCGLTVREVDGSA